MQYTISSAFSINMLKPGQKAHLLLVPLTIDEARAELDGCDVESAIGHPDTAAVVSGMLGLQLEANRINIQLTPVCPLLVAQYTGPRLPEGATELPEGARIEFWSVSLKRANDVTP